MFNFAGNLKIKNNFEKAIKFLNVTSISPPYFYKVDNLIREIITTPDFAPYEKEPYAYTENAINEMFDYYTDIF